MNLLLSQRASQNIMFLYGFCFKLLPCIPAHVGLQPGSIRCNKLFPSQVVFGRSILSQQHRGDWDTPSLSSTFIFLCILWGEMVMQKQSLLYTSCPPLLHTLLFYLESLSCIYNIAPSELLPILPGGPRSLWNSSDCRRARFLLPSQIIYINGLLLLYFMCFVYVCWCLCSCMGGCRGHP